MRPSIFTYESEFDGADDDGFGDSDGPGGFYVLAVNLESAPATGFRGEGPGFEEADGPKPFIDADELNSEIRKEWS